VLFVESPSQLPDVTEIKEIREPMVHAVILTTEPYLGKIIELVNEKRGSVLNVEYMGSSESNTRVKLSSSIPLAEIITNFFDRLKSISAGYASLDYEFSGFQRVDAIKLEIVVSGQIVDALARIVPKIHSERLGREVVERLKEVIPRQQYEVAIQAALGGSPGVVGRIIARADVKAYRKDVTGKLYGGDRTRKDKLLDKQKEGKKKMKKIGKFELPQEAFLEILKQD
jgi:GTP-binding protein LepA